MCRAGSGRPLTLWALRIILRTVAEELEGKSTEAAIIRSSDN